MRKLRIILLTILGLALMTSTAWALTLNTAEADHLNELGVLLGSDRGYELEKSLTRAEGATLLVRLLGKEGEAKSVNPADYSHPFADVPAWADLYVDYLYSHGLTKGVSATAFGADDSMTALQYATFVLRALGYDDSQGDFAWDSSLDKLEDLSIMSSNQVRALKSFSFIRNDVVLLSYNALYTTIKGTDILLVDKILNPTSVEPDPATPEPVNPGPITPDPVQADPNDKNNLIADGAGQADNTSNSKGTTPTSAKRILDKKIPYLHKLTIGDSLQLVLDYYGQPERIDVSQYDFDWYIYKPGTADYFQVGIKNKEVVALLSLSGREGQLKDLKNKTNTRNILGQPVDSINIGNTRYIEGKDDAKRERDIFPMSAGDIPYYIYVYYDLIDNDIIGVQLLSQTSRQTVVGFITPGSNQIRDAYEIEQFDISNAMRAQRGLGIYEWSDLAAQAARLHSQDMAAKNYFAHENLQGKSPFDRMKAVGIKYYTAAENLNAGYEDPIMMHVGWMNSEGHRSALLNPNLTHLGLGVAFGGDYHVYATQNFYTP